MLPSGTKLLQCHAFLHPDIPLNKHVIIASAGFHGIVPIFIDSILLLRLYAAYPYRYTSRWRFAFIMGFAVLLKIGRLINTGIFVSYFSRTITATTGVEGAAILVTSKLPSIKIEWTLQVVDDVYVVVRISFKYWTLSAYIVLYALS